MESSFFDAFDPRHSAALHLPKTLPTGNGLTRLYQRLLRQNQLLGATCRICQHTHFPPKSRCEHCHSDQLEPVYLSGRGQLYSADIPRSPDELSVGHILLEEGFWVRALLVGAFKNAARLATAVEDKPLDVLSCVLCTQGLAILAFQPG